MPPKGRKQTGKGISKIIAKIKNAIPSNDATGRPAFPGEHHAVLRLPNGKPGIGNWIGPGTHVIERIRRGDPARTPSDGVARTHDIDYLRAGMIKNKSTRESAIRAADLKMIASLKRIAAAKTDSRVNIAQGMLIVAKVKLEDAGILDKSRFQQQEDQTEEDQTTIEGAGRKGKAKGKAKSNSLPNRWVAHVKRYQATHGCSYREAMTQSKASYKK